MEIEKYDEILLTVAGQCGGIEPLLDVFFSFLYRKTDFFVVMQKGETKMGFPEGVAEKLVLRSFRQFQQGEIKTRQIAKTRAEAAPPPSKPASTPAVSRPAVEDITAQAPPASDAPLLRPLPRPRPRPLLRPRPRPLRHQRRRTS